jgi:UDPglucose--hexose-1-phosphate uridylyltransferase
VKRTAITLADGRQLVYFDEHDDAVRETVDRRDLPPPPPASTMRLDPILREWVAVAAHRQTRTFLPPTNECPLCPSTAEHLSEIPASDYDVVTFENRFPSFSERIGPPAGDVLPGLVPSRPGAGRCEVVAFTADHNASFATLTEARVRTVIDVWADRTAEMSMMDDVELVFPFENRGEEIGVTLHHPHGQIYGYPFIPPRTRQMLHTPGLFARVLAAERAAGVRIVASNEHWTAFVPAAARWPFEIHLYPHRQVPDIPALDSAERAAFGPVYLEVLRRLDGMFGVKMPYISAWYQAPVRAPERELGYLHLELFSTRRAPGKLKYRAGSESAMGVFINDIPPERAAEMLREVTL